MKNIKVVELAMYLPLPYAGAFFANMGASVTKIENPNGGDPLKSMDARIYRTLNRKKKVCRFDLKNSGHRERIKDLILDADIVLNGFRRGFLEKLGLGYDAIKGKNPGIIYVKLTGYEKGLSIADKAGHDLNFVGLSGIMNNFKETLGPLPMQIADMSGALWAIIGVLFMLNKRKTTGTGAELDLSLFRSALSFFPFFYFCEEAGEIDKGLLYGKAACYNVYECKDRKYLTVGSLEEKFFQRLTEIMGVNPSREPININEQEKLLKQLRTSFKKKSSSWWLKKLKNEDICVGPVYSRKEFYDFLKNEGIKGNALESYILFPIDRTRMLKEGKS